MCAAEDVGYLLKSVSEFDMYVFVKRVKICEREREMSPIKPWIYKIFTGISTSIQRKICFVTSNWGKVVSCLFPFHCYSVNSSWGLVSRGGVGSNISFSRCVGCGEGDFPFSHCCHCCSHEGCLILFRLGVSEINTHKARFVHKIENTNKCPFCINYTENEAHVLFCSLPICRFWPRVS